MSKRTISDPLDDANADRSRNRLPQDLQRPHTRSRVDRDPQDHSIPQTSLSYPIISLPTTKQTPFQQPTQLLSFSYDSLHRIEFTDSALRYFVNPPRGANLAYGYERWQRRPEQRGRIDGLLRAFSRVQESDSFSLRDVGVVAWRGVMTRILTSPYEDREGWEMNVMFVDGIMYFEEHASEARLKEKNDLKPTHRLQSYYGYAFESYCTSETPVRKTPSVKSNTPVGWGGDVNTNVQWCSVVRTRLGDTKLIMGGEVDCVRGQHTQKTDTFVELKTSLAIRGPHDEAKFEKKLLKFYFQSFLLGVPEILVGFRTPDGVVTTTQSFKTMEIPRLVRRKPGAWDPLICLGWGDEFLCFLKELVQKEVPHSDPPIWRVKFFPKAGIKVHLLDHADIEDVIGGEDRVGFLPTWYWDKLCAKSPHMDPLTQGADSEKIVPPSSVQIASTA